MKRLKAIAAAVAGALIAAAAASAQAPSEVTPHRDAPSPAPVTQAAPPALTQQDVDAWLDGLMPTALAKGDIAGAVVVVVKDGKVLTQKGYGFADVKAGKKADPQTTLFRVGSVSKVFTWTAVMQQVEAGKIDLNADINRYLDFKIPPYQGKPITMRDLMTHTAGFEGWGKNLFVGSPKRIMPLDKLLKTWVPKRIFAPGEVPAYSNYGASLAGYIVQRVSGQPFDDYVEQHIFSPLGMAHSTFRQPEPKALEAQTALPYARASLPAQYYEYIPAEPCGSLSATAADIANFMIAHLQEGRFGSTQILRPETARLMHAEQPKLNPPLNYMALGFYHEDRNGLPIIGHAGDTTFFHSDLHLLLDKNVGLFISLNSAGKDGAAYPLRDAFFHGFVDRYFPATRAHLPTAPTAKAHAAMMQGLYLSSLRSTDNFMKALDLVGQAKVTALPDGTIQVSSLHDYAGAPKVWREVGPFVWKDAEDDSTLAAVVKDGKVVNFAVSDLPPAFVFRPVKTSISASWNLPLLYFMAAALVLTLLIWPVQALVRRRYGAAFPLQGRAALLYRAARIGAAVQIAALLAWGFLFANLSNATSDGSLDGVMRVAQILCALGVLGTIVMLLNAVVAWVDAGRSWSGRIFATLLAVAGVAFAWFVITLQLVRFTLNY